MRRITADWVRQVGKSRGLEWTGTAVPGSTGADSMTSWRCQFGHEFRMHYASVKNDGVWRGCPVCKDEMRLAEVRKAVERLKERKIVCDGEPPQAFTRPSGWRCLACGNRWRSPLREQLKRRCGTCAKRDRKREVSEYQQLAWQSGYVLLSKQPQNVNEVIEWCCKKCQRVRQASFVQVRKHPVCPACSGRGKKVAEDYRQLAAEHGLRWTAARPPTNTKQATNWHCLRCQCGYVASWDAVQKSSSQSCPICIARKAGALSDRDALVVRSLHLVEVPVDCIAASMGVCRRTVYKIINRETYRWVGTGDKMLGMAIKEGRHLDYQLECG